MASIKKLYFVSGTDVTAPTDLTFNTSTNHIEAFANDADFVTANGAATEGDIYLNTTVEAPRVYSAGAWRQAVMVQDAADFSKTFTVDMSAVTTAKDSKLAFTGTVNRTFTFPDLTGVIVLTTGAQSLTSKTIDADLNTITNIDNADIKSGANIDAAKLGTGAVSNTEFNYLDGVTSPIQTQLNAKQETSEKGAANGYASLDGGGKIPVGQLPNAVMTYEGVWNASTNSPTLSDGTGNAGMVYRVSVAGTQNLGSGAITFDIGDYAVYNSSGVWEKSDTTDAVASVNGTTGIVTVNAINQLTGDVTTTAATQSQSKVATIANGAVTDAKIAAGVDAAKIGSGSVSNTEFGYLDGVTSAIQTQINAKADSSTLSAHTGASAGVHGVTGSVVGTTDAQVITNKDIDGGTASNANRITLPTNTKTNLDALTRKEGTVVYATDTDKLYVDDGATLNEVSGSGGGSGGRNYFSAYFNGTNPVGTVTNGLTATGNRTSLQNTWGADNTAKLTIANNTTNPLRETGDFKLTHVAVGTAFVESPMVQLDLADLSKAVVLSLDLTGNTLAGDFDVVVVRYNSSGTYQETISVAGTASSGTPASAQLPTGTTKFTGFFISSNTQTDYYSVRFRRLSAVATTSVQFDSFFAGPQTVLSGASDTEWIAYTPTVTPISGYTSSPTGFWRKQGDTMEVKLSFIKNGSTGTGGTAIEFGLPSGYTVNTNKIEAGANAARNIFGHAYGYQVTTAGQYNFSAPIGYRSATTVGMTKPGTSSVLVGTDVIANSEWNVMFSVPISQWTSNTTLAERAVEVYASNSGTWNAADSTSFAYGQNGSAIGGTLTGSRTKRVRFETPILPTSKIVVEFSTDRIAWFEAPCILNSNYTVPFMVNNAGTAIAGYLINNVSGSTTDIDITFGQYQYFQPDGDDATNWTSGYWRLRKTDGGASVGYPIGSRNLISDTSGTAIPSGYVGEEFRQTRLRSSPLALSTGVTANVLATALTLQPGTYDLTATAAFDINSATSLTVIQAAISTTSATLPSGDTIGVPSATGEVRALWTQAAATNNSDRTLTMQPGRVSISVATTFYLVAQATFTVSTCNVFGIIRAVKL